MARTTAALFCMFLVFLRNAAAQQVECPVALKPSTFSRSLRVLGWLLIAGRRAIVHNGDETMSERARRKGAGCGRCDHAFLSPSLSNDDERCPERGMCRL